jgi:REP element-mobilizing transposase RayT
MKQLNLFENSKENKARTTHGGMRTKGRRKTKRPLSTKHALHVVLKSKKAIGQRSFFKHQQRIHRILNQYGKRYGVQIKDSVNMGNHIHLKIKITERKYFQNFLRTVTALIARKVTGASKGNKFGKFWDGLVFTRVVKTSFEERQLTGYFHANRVQKKKGYQAREEFLELFNKWLLQLRRRKLNSF